MSANDKTGPPVHRDCIAVNEGEAHDWRVNRGNSIIAGVVLIGILGSLSIALQATAPRIDSNQISIAPRTQTAAVNNAATPGKMGCYESFKYTVRMVKDKPTVDCEQVEQTCFATNNGTEGQPPFTHVNDYEKAGATEKCFAAIRNSKKAGMAQPTQDAPLCAVVGKNDCKLWQCFKVGNGEKCVPIEKSATFNADQGFTPADNKYFGLQELYAKGDEQSLKEIKQSDPSINSAMDYAFAKQMEEQKAAVTQAEQNLGLVKLGCADDSSSQACKNAEQTARDELAAEQRKRLEMQAMQSRLGATQTGEASVTQPCPSGNTCTKGNPAPPTSPTGPTGPTNGNNTNGNNTQRPPASTFPPQQQQSNPYNNPYNNPYQQCYPQYYCMNNSLYWGSPQQQQQQPQYNYSTGSYTYPQQCQNQFVQACQYGCAQPQGSQYSTQCAQNPQQQNPSAPVASLSCGGDGALFDVGMSVPITFSCTNSVSSTGSGFSTNGVVPTGTASAVVQKPPAGADVVSYGLTCTASNNQTVSKRCDVKINVTSMVMVANPRQIAVNATSTIGWVTKGMKTCVISSPDVSEGSALEKFNDDNAEITNVSGVVVTPPLTEDTDFTLSCVSKADQPKSSTIRVKVGS